MEEQNTIAARVINVMRKGLIKFSEEGKNDGIKPSDVQILIALRPDKDSGNLVPYYRVWKKMEPCMRVRKLKEHPFVENTDEVSFKTILGVRLDFAGYEETSKMFLVDTFARMQKELVEFFNQVQNQLKAPDENANPAAIEFIKNNPEFKGFSDEISFGFYEDENNSNSYVPSIEIIIVTPTNEPVKPAALLYYEGIQIRQLDFSNDIFIMPK
jgi:hypothetical protein